MRLVFRRHALPSLLLALFVGVSTQEACRCLYGDSCWPSRSDFEELAAQVTMPLIYPIPPASACYPPSDPSGDCVAVVNGWSDGNWRANQSGAMQGTNFETYVFPNDTISACYLNTSLGFACEQGSVSVVGVDARSVEDVQHGVAFAAAHNLRLIVKNTGLVQGCIDLLWMSRNNFLSGSHDYFGRSTGRGSFVVWTHNMKNITFQESFIPTGAPANAISEIGLCSDIHISQLTC